MRVKQARVHDSGKITVQWEGDDPTSDLGPISTRLSQKEAYYIISLDGTTPGFFVAATNHRRPENTNSREHVKAQRFAERYGLTYRDLVL